MTTTYHVVVATDLTDEALEHLRAAPDIALHAVTPKTRNIREAIQNAHAIIARDDVTLDAELIASAPHLKVIGRVGAALSGLDIDAASARGVVVMNSPGTSALAAGEHTLLLMLALSRKLTVAHNSIRDGWWLLDRKRQAGTQLYGKTLGLIGLGRVGRVVAERAAAFGMTVLAYDPYLGEEQARGTRVTLVGLKELLGRSDFISVHVPATAETRGLLNAERLAQVKPGARLVNTAHGSLWDEAAVAEALQRGHLAGVAVDVYPEEPPYSSPLLGLENVVHTPHIGDNTVEAVQDLSLQIVRQVLDALHDQDYRNAVNLPFMPGTDFEAVRPYLVLAERIGLLQHTVARAPIKRVAVECRGDGLEALLKPVTVALLKGILAPVLGDKVSYINAPLLAAERGLQVTEARGLGPGTYSHLLSCEVVWEDGTDVNMSGTLLDGREPHIVQIDRYALNFVPQGHLLVMGSHDRPGVIGRVGTLLAENGVNIASWHTGRIAPGGHTLTVLNLDEPAPDGVVNTLREQDLVRHAAQVALPAV